MMPPDVTCRFARSLDSWLSGREGTPRVAISRTPHDGRLLVEIYISQRRWEALPLELREGQLIRCVV